MSRFDDLLAREVFLNPGEVGCGYQREVFCTLLGSCVSITLWHPKRRFGSISHFILPTGSVTGDVEGKYGNHAFECQKQDLIRYGINIRQCLVKIFGGGQMFSTSGMQDIGLRNITMAHKLISDSGLTVTSENVGDEGYRRLYFDVESGEVWVKFDWIDSDQEDKIL